MSNSATGCTQDDEVMASRTHSPSVSSASLPAHHATPVKLSSVERAKEDLIIKACESQDFAALKDLSTSTHGLVSDDLRRIAWPLLLGCANVSVEQTPWQTLPAHGEEGQVALDVNRAFVYYPSHGQCRLFIITFSSQSTVLTELSLGERARPEETRALQCYP